MATPTHLPGYEDAEVLVHATAEAAVATLGQLISASARAAVDARGVFTLVLSGGSLPSQLGSIPPAVLATVPWDLTHVFYVDERNVPHSSPDSTHKLVLDHLVARITAVPDAPKLQLEHFHAIHEGLDVAAAAADYDARLRALAAPGSVLATAQGASGSSSGPSLLPVFDFTVLGMGPDGHIASLFPGRGEVDLPAGGPWVIPIEGSPKPPPERITMTLPVINASKVVAFVALGAGKADVVQQALEQRQLGLPAQKVRPAPPPDGRMLWLLDAGSAGKLSGVAAQPAL